jgi:peptide/nickel transport system substrate-binding protein
MSSLLQRFRAFLSKLFFWHGDGARSKEFIPEPAHDHALVLAVSDTPRVPRWRQLRYAARVLSGGERRVVLAMAILLCVAIAATFWFFLRGRLIPVPAAGGRIVEAIVGAPKYPHPFYAATNDPDQDLVTLVYSGLFRRVDGSRVEPDLVERFEWTTDGKKLTLVLRTDARFHDGTPVTADDVVFTLMAAKDPAWKSPFVNALRGMTIEHVDDRTVALTLTNADATLLDTLTLGILPAHVWQDIPPGSAHLADANVRPIGSGPFRVRSFVRDARGSIAAYTLERNDRYYGAKPLVDQLELRFFPDRATAEEALRGGQVDALAFVPGPEIDALTKHGRLLASILELPQETIVFFNVQDSLLKDIRIRQALALSVERSDVLEVEAGIASPVFGPFPFISTGAPTSTPEERLDQARALLNAAGWIMPADGNLRVKKTAATSTRSGAAATSTPAAAPELTLTLTVPDVPDLIAVADALARRWSLLGVRAEVRAEPAEELARRVVTARDAQILVWNVLLSPSQDPFPIWWSGEATGRGLNLSNLADRMVDDAIETLHAATTTEGLSAARDLFTKAVLARTPAVFLTRPGYGYVHDVRLHGMDERLQLGKPSDRWNDAINWYVKTAWKWK